MIIVLKRLININFLTITLFFGFKPNWALVPASMLFMFMLALAFTALGVTIASKLEDMQAFPIIMNFIIMPIFFLSGALFPLNNLNGYIDTITKINPLTYGVDGIRGTLTNVSHMNVFLDISIITLFMLVLFLIGTYMFSKTEA